MRVLPVLLLAACGVSMDDIAWVSPSEAFGGDQWVLVYRDLPG